MPQKEQKSVVILGASMVLSLYIICRCVIPSIVEEENEKFTNKKEAENEEYSASNSVLTTTGNVGESLLPPPAVQNTVYLINLKRRPDRLTVFRRDFAKSDINMELKLIEGVDGSKLDIEQQDLTELARAELKQLETTGYRSKHYQLTRGGIGCYLSHIKVWNAIIKDNSNIGLVFEDDSTLPPNIQQATNEALKNPPSDWDMILLGVACHTCSGVRTRPGFLRVKRFWLTHAYLIKSSAIKKIFKSDALFPIAQQIDSLLSELSNTIKIYAVTPGICDQRQSRTDIQAPLKAQNGEDPLARMPVGVGVDKNRSITTKITNSMLPTTYQKNGGSAGMPSAADLNIDEEKEAEDLDNDPNSNYN